MTDENVHRSIRELRIRLGMTQEEFAHAVAVTFSTVNRWENGHAKPSKLARRAIEALARRGNPRRDDRRAPERRSPCTRGDGRSRAAPVTYPPWTPPRVTSPPPSGARLCASRTRRGLPSPPKQPAEPAPHLRRHPCDRNDECGDETEHRRAGD